MLHAVFVPPLVALATCAPPSRPLIGEILYDALGDDTGIEFVELHNPTATPHPLAGLRLEAGDGAGPGRWTVRWTGAPGDTIAAGGRFVVGGARLTPAPDAVVQLELQNGPDAVRLVWPDGAVEVVGYGAVAWPEYACGAPAADVPSGLSLARTPDDADRGANALDFAAAAPSPGAANRPARDAALVGGALALEPEQPDPGAPATLSALVANRGGEPIADGELTVAVGTGGAGGGPPLAEAPIARTLAPGDTARVAVALPGLAAGKRWLRAAARLAGDAASANDADSLAVRIGPGPLELTEIQFHPAGGEGEWVEARNRGDAPLDPAGFTVSDRRGAPGLASGGGGALAPESLIVFAQDRAALLARFPALDPARVWEARPWGALNNADDSTGVADVVVLREIDGTPCERVPYSAAGVPAGVPLERRADGSWGAAAGPPGGPLAPPRPLAPLGVRFAVAPRRIAPATGGSARIGWDLPWPRARVTVDLYDLAGRHLARVLPETAVGARGERSWAAAGVPPGLYVLALLARAEAGGGAITATQAVRVEGGVP